MSANRLAWLDLFRGVAALVVVAFHFHAQLHLPEIRFGPLAVDLFFVLSGIVLGRKYHDAILGGLTFGEFAWQRARRLYPMVLITVALIVGMTAVGVQDVPWAHVSVGTVLGLAFVMPYSPTFGSNELFPADGPVWSLFAELLANAIWFVTLKWSKDAAKAVFAAAMVGFLVLKFQVAGIHIRSDESGWLNIIAGQARALAWFGVGCAISMRRPKLSVPLFATLFFAMCAAVQRGWLPDPIAQTALIAAGAALLAGLVHKGPGTAGSAKFCGWMGMLSFPIYMTHVPASRIAVWLAAHGVKTTIAFLATFLVVGAAAAVLNEWVIRRLPTKLRSQDLASIAIKPGA
ncbi:MAG: acyltransferase [Burkholderiaceae bacterium]